MATCGYICPKCEGRSFNPETLLPCDWCQKQVASATVISDEDWIKTVHESNCCSDIGIFTDLDQK